MADFILMFVKEFPKYLRFIILNTIISQISKKIEFFQQKQENIVN